jgi:hypothetical protein
MYERISEVMFGITNEKSSIILHYDLVDKKLYQFVSSQ